MQRYLDEAGGDQERAAELYLWTTELSGALHAQLSYVELAVRNAIDPHLGQWNLGQGGPVEWTLAQAAQGPLYAVLKDELSQARGRARREEASRPPHHHRAGHPIDHNDIVAQLMFGAWAKIIQPVTSVEPNHNQKDLWSQGLHRAFPNLSSSDVARVALGSQLHELRRLRNRVAHHDNLLEVKVSRRLNTMLSVMAGIDRTYPDWALARSSLRRIAKDDPRRAW